MHKGNIIAFMHLLLLGVIFLILKFERNWECEPTSDRSPIHISRSESG